MVATIGGFDNAGVVIRPSSARPSTPSGRSGSRPNAYCNSRNPNKILQTRPRRPPHARVPAPLTTLARPRAARIVTIIDTFVHLCSATGACRRTVGRLSAYRSVRPVGGRSAFDPAPETSAISAQARLCIAVRSAGCADASAGGVDMSPQRPDNTRARNVAPDPSGSASRVGRAGVGVVRGVLLRAGSGVSWLVGRVGRVRC